MNNNIRGHTEGAVLMGYRIIYGKSSKQNMNVKSSTYSELVGMGKYVPYNIWFIMFIGAQGYVIENNVIYQDNQSTISMEKNG